jgi:uncharacterized protein (DUF2225 family)
LQKGPESKTGLPSLPPELFWKKYIDPLSGETFSAVSVKRSAYTLRGHDPDFAPHYEGSNPLWYTVVVSNTGFAGEQELYKHSSKLLIRNRSELMEFISGQPGWPEFNLERDIETACRTFELALGYTHFLRVSRYEIASLALKASWVYSQWAETGHQPAKDQARIMRQIALKHYLESYEKEDNSEKKFGSAGVTYLIAELMREQGNFDESLAWFSRALTDGQVRGEVKRLAQDQRELCRKQRENALAGDDYSKPVPERQQERAVYQLFRDQTRWLKKGSKIGESELLRTILDGMMQAGVDPERFSTPEKLAAWLNEKLNDAG